MTFHVFVFLLSVCLLLSLALLWRLGWLPLQPSHSAVASRRSPIHRLLKPRTPLDCPSCRLGSPPSSAGGSVPTPVRPWPEVKSRRGAPKRIGTEGFACPNPHCPYFGITDAHLHALVGDGKHGHAEPIQTFRGPACHSTFSARRSTPLYRLKTPSHQVAVALSALAEGLDSSEALRVFGFRQATITRWLTRAGGHAHTLHGRFFFHLHLHLPHLQLDELRTRLRCATQVLWLWLAIDPLTKILPVLELGPRTQHMAHRVIHSLRQLLAPDCLPLFTSDGLNVYFYALTAQFGHWLQVGRRGRLGRRWQVAAGLIYGQVKKCYRRRKLIRVTHVMRFGTEGALTATLQGLGFSGRVNTAFIERVNLTVRHGVSALARRTWATAQQSPQLLAHVEWWAPTIILCVPTKHYEWRSRGRENEVASVWRNAIGNELRRWQPGELSDDGRRAKCSPTHCHPFPLERLSSQRWVQCHVAGSLVHVPAEALDWSRTPESGSLSGLPTDKKQPEIG